MDIDIIGGGPGGLYASLLLKKSNPDWDISVYERDSADNTYGWGIVFSGTTLSALREADEKTHAMIEEAFAVWDPIDVHYGGERIRCGGHKFSGLMRADLKDILRRRADELGVEMHWDHTVEDPTAYATEADLLIGADGLNSTTREAYADQFSPRVTEGTTKFAWFGTDKPFDVFTFVFRENEHGFWRIHAYPGRMSTFIVECTEQTYLNAGLDEKDEAAALAYFEDLFADHLAGYELESKLYAWRNFPVVENRSWFDDEDGVLLLGDAAHTAHYSVGSGTKMAMEDAIALADAFEEFGVDRLESVADWFEKERRPRVEGIQEAARKSRKYFENTERYADLPPEQFAFNLLTRSGAITYDELKIRDDTYTDDFDRWYARRADGSRSRVIARPPMFQPFELGGVTVDNRAVFAPNPSSVGSSGRPSAEQTDRLVDLAAGGPGLVLTEPVAVSARGRISPGTPGIYEDDHTEAWASAVADAGAESPETTLGIELCHAGQRAATEPRSYGLDRPLADGDAWEVVSASATRYTKRSQQARAMDDADLEAVREWFVAAAENANAAGFDVLQLHAGHGYLLSSFLSPLTNDRDDEYGGDSEGRLRYPLSVFDAVRSVWPEEKPITVKIPATDWRPEGNSLSDAFAIGEAFADHGADLLTVVAGQTTANDRAKFDTDVLARYSEQIRNELNTPTMSTNYITTTDDVSTQVGRATSDLCEWHPPGVGINSL